MIFSRFRRHFRICAMTACFFLHIVSPVNAAGGVPACPHRLDSLITAGNRCLDLADLPCARRCFTTAFKCGMNRDSLCYFAAEIYIRTFALDTALTFNQAAEKGGSLPREVFLEQRSRIFRSIGWNREADSILSLIRKKEQHDIAVNIFASRGIMGLNPLTLAPQQRTFPIPEDIDDIGHGDLSYQWARSVDAWPRRLLLRIDANTDAKIPTRHSFDEASDTLIRSIAFALGAGGGGPLKPEFTLGHQMNIHDDGNTDHFTRINFSHPAGIKRFLAAKHETKWTGRQGIDASRTELMYTQISRVLKSLHSGSFSLSYHYSKSDLYQNKLGTSGLYKAVPIGYVDSLIDKQFYRYCKSPLDTARVPIEGFGLYDYWTGQPRLRLVTIPEHDVNATLNSFFSISLPFRTRMNLVQSIQCLWFPEKLRWYSFKPKFLADTTAIKAFDNDYAIVYNAADGKCYLNDVRSDHTYYEGNLKEITIQSHEKTRIDCYISLSMIVERPFGNIGKFYFLTTYVKGLSTLKRIDPVVGLNYYWGLQAGWKKDISLTR
jgi:hypothetical protein